MKKWLLFFSVLCLTACFNEETRYVAYLERDGSVTLNVYVENVFSTEDTQKKRSTAEKKLLEKLIEETDIPLLTYLEETGGDHLEIIMIHEAIPYSYVVKADYNNFEDFLDIFSENESGLNFDVDVEVNKPVGYIEITNSEFKASSGSEQKDTMFGESDTIRVFVSGAFDIQSDTVQTMGENSFVMNNTFFENCKVSWKYTPGKKKNKLE